MHKILYTVHNYLTRFGSRFRSFFQGMKNLPAYFYDFFEIRKYKDDKFNIYLTHLCLREKNDNSGNAKGHYFHQDLLIAQEIFKNNPIKHVDIGSRVDGFIAHVASFRDIEVLDIRKNEEKIENITFIQADVMKPDEKYKNYCDSISSLHAIEHFGLGRYGDRIDINGYIKGLNTIYGMLKKGGIFYFSVPIGPQRIEFNAHRVFSLKYLVELLDIYISLTVSHMWMIKVIYTKMLH